MNLNIDLAWPLAERRHAHAGVKFIASPKNSHAAESGNRLPWGSSFIVVGHVTIIGRLTGDFRDDTHDRLYNMCDALDVSWLFQPLFLISNK